MLYSYYICYASNLKLHHIVKLKNIIHSYILFFSRGFKFYLWVIMSEIFISFSFISLLISLGVLWFVAEMTRRILAENRSYIDERFAALLAEMKEMDDSYKNIGHACRDLAADMDALKKTQLNSAGKEQAITASLKEVAKQINSLESMRQKATGTDG